MKLKLCIFIILAGMIGCIWPFAYAASDHISGDDLHRVSSSFTMSSMELYGFADQNGEIVIPIQYQYASAFSEGLALVGRDGVSLFINPSGETVLDSSVLGYSFINSFREGLAVVCQDDQYGYMDQSGRLVIAPQFEEASSFSEGYAAVKIDGKVGYIDRTGNVVIDCQYDSASYFQNGIAKIYKNQKFGFIDTAGNARTPCIYDKAEDFSSGFSCVKIGDSYSYIDQNGLFLVPFQYDDAFSFQGDWALTAIEGKYGFINTDGEEVIAHQYASLSYFDDNIAIAALEREDKSLVYGAIDRYGNKVIPFTYDSIERTAENCYLLKKDDSYFFCDQSYNRISDYIYTAKSGSFQDNIYITLKRDGTYYLVDRKGNEILGRDYEELINIDDNYILAKQSGKYGIIKPNGQIVLPFTYDQITTFFNGVITARKDDTWHLMTVENKPLEAQPDVRLFVRGYKAENAKMPITYQNDCYFPLRAICEMCNCYVGWKEEDSSAVIISGNEIIMVKSDSSVITVNNETFVLDSPPVIVEDTLFVPQSLLEKYLSFDVSYSVESNCFLIN